MLGMSEWVTGGYAYEGDLKDCYRVTAPLSEEFRSYYASEHSVSSLEQDRFDPS